MAIITIVGSGVMGSAMAWPASDNGHTVRLVGTPLDREIIDAAQKTGRHIKLDRTLPKNVTAYQVEQLEEAMAGADLIIGGVSSFGVPWFEENVLPKVPDGGIVLSITKGLEMQEDGTLLPFPEAMGRRQGGRISLNAVGGPCMCYELCDHRDTVVAFCGKDMETLKRLKKLLETDTYHICPTEDVPGVECAVAMKNGFALGVALAIGEKEAKGEPCLNPESALYTQGTRETLKLIRLMGGDEEAICYFSGDLYITVQAGRSRRLGVLLGKGLTYTQAREQLAGVTLESAAVDMLVAEALRRMAKDGRTDLADFPLLMHIDELLHETNTLNLPWKAMSATEK